MKSKFKSTDNRLVVFDYTLWSFEQSLEEFQQESGVPRLREMPYHVSRSYSFSSL